MINEFTIGTRQTLLIEINVDGLRRLGGGGRGPLEPTRENTECTPTDGDTVIWFDTEFSNIDLRRTFTAITNRKPLTYVEKAGWLALKECSRLGHEYNSDGEVPAFWCAMVNTMMWQDNQEDRDMIDEAMADDK